MLALRLPPELEQRLDALAKKAGRSKSHYARKAILRQIEDIEDYCRATANVFLVGQPNRESQCFCSDGKSCSLAGSALTTPEQAICMWRPGHISSELSVEPILVVYRK